MKDHYDEFLDSIDDSFLEEYEADGIERIAEEFDDGMEDRYALVDRELERLMDKHNKEQNRKDVYENRYDRTNSFAKEEYFGLPPIDNRAIYETDINPHENLKESFAIDRMIDSEIEELKLNRGIDNILDSEMSLENHPYSQPELVKEWEKIYHSDRFEPSGIVFYEKEEIEGPEIPQAKFQEDYFKSLSSLPGNEGHFDNNDFTGKEHLDLGLDLESDNLNAGFNPSSEEEIDMNSAFDLDDSLDLDGYDSDDF